MKTQNTIQHACRDGEVGLVSSSPPALLSNEQRSPVRQPTTPSQPNSQNPQHRAVEILPGVRATIGVDDFGRIVALDDLTGFERGGL